MKQTLILILSTLALATYAQKPKRVIKKLGDEPVFFIDSVNVEKGELSKYSPNEIASVSVYKDSSAIRLVGSDGKDGVVYITTKAFAKNQYWNYFRSKSPEYAKVVTSPQADTTVQYILNGRILKDNYEGDLSLINDKVFQELNVIDQQTLRQRYNIIGKTYGVIVKSEVPDDLYKGKKKF